MQVQQTPAAEQPRRENTPAATTPQVAHPGQGKRSPGWVGVGSSPLAQAGKTNRVRQSPAAEQP